MEPRTEASSSLPAARDLGSPLLLALRRVARPALVAAVVVWYVPWLPGVPIAGLDHGWRLALGIACERGFVFGVDLVFPFGPYGCLASWQYWPATYVPSLVFWGVVSLLTAALALPRWGASMLLGLPALLWLGLTVDTALVALPVAHVLHAYRERTTTLTSWASLVAMGPLALVKFTVLPLCIVAAGLGALARGDARPWRIVVDVVVVVAAILGAWIGWGQPLHALDDYLRNSAELATGYADAMAWPTLVTRGMAVPAAVPALLVVVAAAVLALSAWPHGASAGQWSRRLAWPAFSFVALGFAVRHSTTRGDSEHLLLGFVLCGAFGLLTAAMVPPRTSVAVVLALICLASMVYVADQVRSNLVRGSITGRVSATVEGVASLLRAEDPREGLDDALAAFANRLSTASGLRERIDATFDIVGHDQVLLLGLPHGRWAPRPVLQSYAAYTPRLAALNAAHVDSARGPVWLVVPLHTIDGRWPLQDDARLWPLLARRYTVVERVRGYLLLRRSDEEPRPAAEAVVLELQLENWTDLPAPAAGSWYARLELPVSCSGGLLAAVWRPRACHLEVVAGFNPQARRFRLVRAVAADGFLLSPAVLDVGALESWLGGSASDGSAVRRVRVVDDDGAPVSVTLQLSSLPPASDRPR